MFFADSLLRIDFEPTLFSHQRQLFPDPHAAMVKEYVVVGTQAQKVLWRVRPVVRGSEWADMCRLRVGTGEILPAGSTVLSLQWGVSEWPKQDEDVPSRPLEPLNTGDQDPSSYFPNSLSRYFGE
jgi:hypothetical protein